MTKVEVDDRIAKILQDGNFQGISNEEQDKAIELFNKIDEACEGNTNALVMKVTTNLIARCMVMSSQGNREDMEQIAGFFALHLKECVEHHEAVREGRIPATLK